MATTSSRRQAEARGASSGRQLLQEASPRTGDTPSGSRGLSSGRQGPPRREGPSNLRQRDGSVVGNSGERERAPGSAEWRFGFEVPDQEKLQPVCKRCTNQRSFLLSSMLNTSSSFHPPLPGAFPFILAEDPCCPCCVCATAPTLDPQPLAGRPGLHLVGDGLPLKPPLWCSCQAEMPFLPSPLHQAAQAVNTGRCGLNCAGRDLTSAARQ